MLLGMVVERIRVGADFVQGFATEKTGDPFRVGRGALVEETAVRELKYDEVGPVYPVRPLVSRCSTLIE